MKVQRVWAISFKNHMILPSDEALAAIQKIGVVPFRVWKPQAARRLEEYARIRNVEFTKTEWKTVWSTHLVPAMVKEYPGLRVKGSKILVTAADEDELAAVRQKLKAIYRLYGFEVEAHEKTISRKRSVTTLLKVKFSPDMDTLEPATVDAAEIGTFRVGGYQLALQHIRKTATTPEALHVRWSSVVDKEVEVVWSHDAILTEANREALREFAWSVLNNA